MKEMHSKHEDSLLEALHLLKEMKSVDTEKGLKRFETEVLTKTIISPKRNIWNMIRNSAAILIPLLLLANAYLLYLKPSPETPVSFVPDPVKMEVTAMNGSKVFCTLPDSTSVWLRGGSTLVYDAHMKESDERKVELIGEAYFEVKSNKEKPFIVNLENNIDIKVTGTAFNCNTDYEDQIQVTLTEGEVEMVQHTSNGKVSLTSLKPGGHFSYNTKQNTYSVKEVDVRKYMGWKDGYLLFDNDPMKDVIERISAWYGVEILIADREIEKMRFTAQFTDLKLSQIIDILELSSGMSSTYIRGKIDEEGKAIQDQLILRMKK